MGRRSASDRAIAQVRLNERFGNHGETGAQPGFAVATFVLLYTQRRTFGRIRVLAADLRGKRRLSSERKQNRHGGVSFVYSHLEKAKPQLDLRVSLFL